MEQAGTSGASATTRSRHMFAGRKYRQFSCFFLRFKRVRGSRRRSPRMSGPEVNGVLWVSLRVEKQGAPHVLRTVPAVVLWDLGWPTQLIVVHWVTVAVCQGSLSAEKLFPLVVGQVV